MTEEYKKVNDYEHEIPESNKRLVSATIYASDILFEGTKKDVTLKQTRNVVALPEIQKKAIAMNDAYQSYGFSIGGVAAFDSKEEIITPGELVLISTAE